MSTWNEIRQDVLILLGQPTDMAATSDPHIAITARLKRVRDRIIAKYLPETSLTASSSFEVVSTEVEITFTDLGITAADYDYHEMLVVNQDGTDTDGFREWKYVSWKAWLHKNTAWGGNEREDYSWTMDPDQKIYLRTWPGTGQTWNAVLHYYPKSADITDSGTPEIPERAEDYLILQTALSFPHYFQGDKQATIASLGSQLKEARDILLSLRSQGKRDLRLYAKPKQGRQLSRLSTDIYD